LSALLVYQSLWATLRRAPGRVEASVEARFDEVKAAGFDGICIDLGSMTLDDAKATRGDYLRTGLKGLVTAFPTSIEDLVPAIDLAKDVGAPFLIVVGQVTPIAVPDMIETVRAWLSVAARENFPVQFETHRDSVTNDLFSTLQILSAIPELKLSADLSHYVVDRELSLPLEARMSGLIDQVIARAGSFQGRVATGQHIQVPLHFPQHQPWVCQFETWWRSGVAHWKASAALEDELVFLCELGPPEYAITGFDGLELSDRQAEAVQLMDLARRIWAES
jgi:hypothetical protein